MTSVTTSCFHETDLWRDDDEDDEDEDNDLSRSVMVEVGDGDLVLDLFFRSLLWPSWDSDSALGSSSSWSS